MRPGKESDFFDLSSGKMQIRVLTPWSKAYGRTRFDHMGFISEIWYNGFRYSQKEQLSPPKKASGGSGICFEFKSDAIENDSAIGEEYLKIGTGSMTRTAQPWTILDEGKTNGLPASVEVSENEAVFSCESPIINGYGYHETRWITVSPDSIAVRTQMRNIGSKPLPISEYSHNFLCLQEEDIDTTTSLELPCVLNPSEEVRHPGMIGAATGINWAETPRESVSQLFQKVKEASPYAWKLTEAGKEASITGTVNFQPEHVFVWSRSYCVCAEIYYGKLLSPGDTAEWIRKWSFT